MGFFDNILFHVDEGISGLFGQWNLYSTGLVTVLIGLLSYQIFARQDADVHPMLLARQAQSSPVRQQGESAVYRCQAAPHGMPLNSGLNVKDPGAAKWARGRDGDLRDIWRQATAGVKDDVSTKGQTGRILTVLGREKVVDHKLGGLPAMMASSSRILTGKQPTSRARSTSSASPSGIRVGTESPFTSPTRLSSWRPCLLALSTT